MYKEPKYLIKFTNVQNDNGTVWYTIDVDGFSFRFSFPRRMNIGHSNRGSAICAIYILPAKSLNIGMSCLCSHRANCLEALIRRSFKKGKKSFKITTILFSKQLILTNFRNCFSSSIIINRPKKWWNLALSHQNYNLIAQWSIRKKTNNCSSKRYFSKLWQKQRQRWSKATNMRLKSKTKQEENLTSNSKR